MLFFLFYVFCSGLYSSFIFSRLFFLLSFVLPDSSIFWNILYPSCFLVFMILIHCLLSSNRPFFLHTSLILLLYLIYFLAFIILTSYNFLSANCVLNEECNRTAGSVENNNVNVIIANTSQNPNQKRKITIYEEIEIMGIGKIGGRYFVSSLNH